MGPGELGAHGARRSDVAGDCRGPRRKLGRAWILKPLAGVFAASVIAGSLTVFAPLWAGLAAGDPLSPATAAQTTFDPAIDPLSTGAGSAATTGTPTGTPPTGTPPTGTPPTGTPPGGGTPGPPPTGTPPPGPTGTPAGPSSSPPPPAPPHNTAPHEFVPHNTAPHNTAPHNTAPHNTAPHNTAPHEFAPHNTAPHEHGAGTNDDQLVVGGLEPSASTPLPFAVAKAGRPHQTIQPGLTASDSGTAHFGLILVAVALVMSLAGVLLHHRSGRRPRIGSPAT